MPGGDRGGRSARAGKQGSVLNYVRSLEHSPSKRKRSSPGTDRVPAEMDSIRELLEEQFEKFAKLKEDFQEIADSMKAEFGALKQRVHDLEVHIERKDEETEILQEKVQRYEEQIVLLESRIDANEANSRLPTLVLSGPAVARSAPGRRSSPGSAGSSTSPGTRAAPSGAGGGGPPGSTSGPAPDPASQSSVPREEDVPATVVDVLNASMPGLNLQENDIARAHRDRSGKKIWCCFVRSGPGSVRDEVYSRRLSLKSNTRDNALFINESLSKMRLEIFNELLSLKRQKKVYTVFTRNGIVFYKDRQYGQNVRVDEASKLAELRAS